LYTYYFSFIKVEENNGILDCCEHSGLGVFRDANAICNGCFAENIPDCYTAFTAKLYGVMIAIEIADRKNWRFLWLETDSQLVVLALKDARMVPWNIRNRWSDCLDIISNMNFLACHMYREGNTYADGLATLGLALSSQVWFPSIPDYISTHYVRNRLGLPNYRFIF